MIEAFWLLVRDNVIIDHAVWDFDTATSPFGRGYDLREGDILIRDPSYPTVHKWDFKLSAWKVEFGSRHSEKYYPEMPGTFFMSAMLIGLNTTDWNIVKSTQ